MGRLAIDLSGKRFGKLLVVSRVENREGRPSWLCQCDCGNSKVVMGGNLKTGATKSCGCQEGLGVSPLYLAGRRFGKLLAHSLVSIKPPVWNCDCDCGRTVLVRSSYLLGGKQDCGCSYKGGVPQQIGAAAAAVKLRKRPFESLYNSLCARAKRKQLEVISYEEFLEFTQIQKCHYCDSGVVWVEYGLRKGRAVNLDRKDSSRGYTVNNVVVCCTRCNKAKLDHFTYDEWVKIGAFIRDNNLARGN